VSNHTTIFIFHGLSHTESTVMWGHVIDSYRSGKEINIIACARNYSCSYNPLGIKSLCALCVDNNRNYLKAVEVSVGVPINVHWRNYTELRIPRVVVDDYSESSLAKLKGGNGSDVGYAVLSTLYGIHRSSHLKLDGLVNKSIINKLIDSFLSIYEAVNTLKLRPGTSEISVFNGRITCSRAVIRAAANRGIKFKTFEYVSFKGVYIKYDGVMPHDLDYTRRLVEKLYLEYRDDAQEISQYFYNSKRSNKFVGDRVFTEKQSAGLLPREWDNSSRNIVFFTSTDFELAAIGPDYCYTLFSNQIDAIQAVIDTLGLSEKLYVRMHPNFSHSHRSDIERFQELHDGIKCIVILPDDPVSTYALLDSCDLVIGFSSTVTAEAIHAKKPAFELGPRLAAIIEGIPAPTTLEELSCYLKNEPRLLPRVLADKFAIYRMKRGESSLGMIELIKNSENTPGLFAWNVSYRYHFLRAYQKIILFFT
jgi:hypothetical protein